MDHSEDDLTYLLEVTHDESVYARRNFSTSIPLELELCDHLAELLRNLSDIAMRAPGGHGHLIDYALRYASALSATEPRK